MFIKLFSLRTIIFIAIIFISLVIFAMNRTTSVKKINIRLLLQSYMGDGWTIKSSKDIDRYTTYIRLVNSEHEMRTVVYDKRNGLLRIMQADISWF